MDCIFCKIANKEIPSKMVYENDDVYAFYDIDPKAPVHVLIIPKHHFDSILEADPETVEQLFSAAKEIVSQLGLTNGFRLVINTGDDGGQTVKHLHLHILGKRQLHWPPG